MLERAGLVAFRRRRLQVAEMTTLSPTTDQAIRSAAAERVRAYRERRRYGMRCVTLEIHEEEIDVLIRLKLLRPDTRNDLDAVKDAIYAHLDGTLGAE